MQWLKNSKSLVEVHQRLGLGYNNIVIMVQKRQSKFMQDTAKIVIMVQKRQSKITQDTAKSATLPIMKSTAPANSVTPTSPARTSRDIRATSKRPTKSGKNTSIMNVSVIILHLPHMAYNRNRH
jgi:hypothetical protein